MSKCEKCGVELDPGDTLESDQAKPESLRWVHTPERCRDRLAARLAEAEAKAEVRGGEWCAKNRAEGRGPCGACAWCCAALRAELETTKARLAEAEGGTAAMASGYESQIAALRIRALREDLDKAEARAGRYRDATQAELSQRAVNDSYGRNKSACQTLSDILDRRGKDFSLEAALAETEKEKSK